MTAKSIPYVLEKSVWTHSDFQQMGWHDVRIYGLATRGDFEEPWKNEFLLDIDYIFQWVDPVPPSSYYSFWVAPCTLVFHGYYDLVIDVESGPDSMNSFEIDALNLAGEFVNEHNHLKYYSWEIELQSGLVSLKSEGYEQYVRTMPLHVGGQILTSDQRGEISFAKVAV